MSDDVDEKPLFSPERLDGVIFDLDGVLTDTASTHQAAWKEVFDQFLRRHLGDEFAPFTKRDYRRYVDGKPRFDGIRSFLASRNIELPEGEPTDEPGFDSVYGLGMEKNRRYQKRLADGQIAVFDDSVDCAKHLVRQGLKVGLVSSSRNAKLVTELVDIDHLFSARVDGQTLADEGLAGKPDPEMFVEAARRMGVTPSRAAVVEDAESGVKAGRRGQFGLVVGLASEAEQRKALRKAGADVAVERLRDCVR